MKADRAGAILGLALGILLISLGIKLPPGKEGAPGPGFFPVWIGVGLLAFSVFLWVRPQGTQRLGDLFPRGKEARRVAWALLALILYAALLKPIGFLITTFLLFLTLLQFYQRGRWWAAVALSLAAVLGSYWLFARFFEMPLPEGLLAL
jgi:putative tricarboxylic transport membrane protein